MNTRRRKPKFQDYTMRGGIMLFGAAVLVGVLSADRNGFVGMLLATPTRWMFGELSWFWPLLLALVGIAYIADPSAARIVPPAAGGAACALLLTAIVLRVGWIGLPLHYLLSGQWATVEPYLLGLCAVALASVTVKDSIVAIVIAIFRLSKDCPAPRERNIPAPSFPHAPNAECLDGDLPPLSLLASSTTEQDLPECHSDELSDTLAQFGVATTLLAITSGRGETRYDYQLDRGTKLSQVEALDRDLALAVGVPSVSISPVPKSAHTIGISVPHERPATVGIYEILQGTKKSATGLPVAIGMDVQGTPITADLCAMPHLLIAGTTGSGKSVCINVILASLLTSCGPSKLRLLLIDPKMVELSGYNGIPHLLRPVVTDATVAASALSEIVAEMERRYALLESAGCNKLDAYNAKHPTSKLPYIVVIIDELADLMMTSGKEVEPLIVRIAQKARAAGIHLVVATQRPSKSIITGLIKANIPSRIAFAVSSDNESRIILDDGGAEKLAGRGDMLFAPVGARTAIHLQGAYAADSEVEAVVKHWQRGKRGVRYAAAVEGPTIEATAISSTRTPEDLIQAATRAVRFEGLSASTKAFKGAFHIGYDVAKSLLDELETRGVVGPPDGKKPRTVLAIEVAA